MINILKTSPENNYPKAIAISIALLVGFLILSIFYIINKAEPMEEVGTGGIIVNYGTSDIGMGDDYMSVDEVSADPNANQTAPDKITPNAEATPEKTVNQPTESKVVTQDFQDAPAVNTKTEKTNTAPATQNTEAKETKPTVNQNALYKGKKSQGTGIGDGTGDEAGNQGKAQGDPFANNYDGTGSGNGGVALDIKSRRFVSTPVIKDDGQKSGKIVVEIRVDKHGNVIAAKAGARGTTLPDRDLWDKCETAALGSRFNTLDSAPETQIGYITFNFKVK
ncbi:energy transducer TonB [Pseudopedobacter beijingensis]|uniref:Energy transducer TonB n=1 Tax=Pseudopedobacter beijingensis TaxID=1207056 RepID=A0ABW4IFL7_9SPHI